MKKVLKMFIFLLTFLSFSLNVKADLIDHSGGSSGNLSNIGKGNWDQNSVAIKISIVSSNNVVKDAEIFLNSNGIGTKSMFSANNYPKNHQSSEIKWLSSSKVKTYKVSSILPTTWYDSKKNIYNIHDILVENDYKNLKYFLEHVSLKDSLESGDYIIVEPMTKISGYYGTAYELANSGFLGASDNKIGNTYWGTVFGGAYYGASNDKRSGGVFRNTIYLTENLPNLGIYIYQDRTKQCKANFSTEMQNNGCLVKKNMIFKDKTSGVGIGVFEYNKIYKEAPAKVEIKKVKSGTTSLITSASTTFRIYNSANCNGTLIKEVSTGKKGKVTLDDLEEGVYSVYESQVPTGYVPPSDRCVIRSFTVTPGENISLTVENTGLCDTRLNDLKQKYGNSIPESQIKNLFLDYPNFNGLLNLSNPSCKVVNCGTTNKIQVTGCLSATGSYGDEDDFSCSQRYTNGYYNAWCKDKFTLTNNLGTNKFYAKSGQFLLRKYTNYFEIYNNQYEPVKINTNYLTTATVERECLVFDRKDGTIGTQQPSIDIYFNNKKLVINKQPTSKRGPYKEYWYTEPIYHPKTCRSCSTCCSGSGEERKCSRCCHSYDCSYYTYVDHYQYRYFYTFTYNYKMDDYLNSVYVENLTGDILIRESDKDPTKKYDKYTGIISKFNEETGVIPFRLVYGELDASNSSSRQCTYEVKKEIVPEESNPTELEIEFRSIDTNTPFTRDTKSNWCSSNNCGSNNSTVRNEIVNAPNSYGTEPIYTITLTPQDIEIIRNYNEDHPYDDFELTTSPRNNKYNSFVYNLVRNGTVNGRRLSNKLISKQKVYN